MFSGVGDVVALMLVVGALICLGLAYLLLREVRATLLSTQRLFESLQSETLQLVKESTTMLVGTKTEVARARDLVELSEVQSQVYSSVSRTAFQAMASPIIRFRAFRLGLRRGVELFRSRREG
jgi:hypothetical protein